MALFVAQHQHRPETCPAAPTSGFLLLDHVSAATAARYGVAIQAEAVLDGEHGLILILEAADRARVEAYMGYFAPYGPVQVFPAASGEEAVARGSCASLTHDHADMARAVPAARSAADPDSRHADDWRKTE